MNVPPAGDGCHDRVLVFSVVGSAAVRPLFDVPAVEAEPGGLSDVFDYVRTHPHAALRPLAPEHGAPSKRGDNWTLALPNDSPSRRLSTVYFLTAETAEDATRLAALLRGDRVRVDYVHFAAAASSLPIEVNPSLAGPDHSWALTCCGFIDTWPELDAGPMAKPVALLDDGSKSQHPALGDRIIKYVSPTAGGESTSTHAGAVCAVLGAERHNDTVNGMAGCCSARMELFNLWNDNADFDCIGYYDALKQAAHDVVTVINMSFGCRAADPTTDLLFDLCIKAGIVLVAAVAKAGDDRVHPAIHPSVIAVGATGQTDEPTGAFNAAGRLWICAPGTKIWSVHGSEYKYQDGTSLAAPMVSAAAWLAKRWDSSLTPGDVRTLLACSTVSATPGERTDAIGYGRLDVRKLATQLGQRPRPVVG